MKKNQAGAPGADASPIAKLTRPRLRGAIVRQRLIQMLDGCLQERPVCCLVAPPGAGKTTLVASWLEVRDRRDLWMQLDAGDADLATFFFYLGQAVRPHLRKGMRAMPLLTPEYQSDIAGFSRRYFRELFRRLPDDAVIVLDNYQEVPPNQLFHEIIAQAVEEVPQGHALVIISRRDPPDCYARLIANQAVSFLEWDELQLTLDEARLMAARRGIEDLPWVDKAFAATEGWAAGLVLLLERRHGADGAMGLGQGYERIFAYFADQVLSQLPDGVQRFLMIIAWMPSTSVDTAQSLTGDGAARDILEDLYRRQLFVHRRAGDPPSYQLHALFREFLQTRATRLMDAADLHATKCEAARLLARENEVDAALDLYFSVGQWQQAVDQIVVWAPRLLAAGRGNIVKGWIDAIPEPYRHEQPWLRYWLGRTRLSVDPGQGKIDFQRAYDQFKMAGHDVGQVMCLAAIMETHWLQWIDFPALDGLIENVLAVLARAPHFPETRMELRAHTILLVALSHRRPGSPAIQQVQSHVMALMAQEQDNVERLLAATILVGHALPPFDLALARWAEEQVADFVEHSTVTALMRINWLIRLACHYTHRGIYEQASALMQRAQGLAESEQLGVGLINRCWWGNFVSLHAGNLALAEHYGDLLEANRSIGHAFKHGVTHNIRCMIALARGQSGVAVEHGRIATRIAFDDGPAWSIAYFSIPTLFALIEDGHIEEARDIIARLRAYIAGTFIQVLEAELLLAEAYVELRQGASETQLRCAIVRAMTFSREHNYVFGFRSLFRAHRVLFDRALCLGVEITFLRQAIAQFRMRPDPGAGAWWPWEVKVFTLGGFEVRLQDEAITFGRKLPRKVLGLLKCIVAHGGVNVPAHRLIDALWQEEDGATAHHAFGLALHRLRRMLGSVDTVLYTDSQVSLNRQRVWVDTLEFDALAAKATPESTELLVKTYRGEFLPQEADATWAIHIRGRLAARFVERVISAGAALEAREDLVSAAALYRRALDAAPQSGALQLALRRVGDLRTMNNTPIGKQSETPDT